MKILMINVVCGIRSTGRICTDLAAMFETEGHEVRIAYGREAVPEQFKKYAVRIGSDIDVRLHGVKARLFDGCGFGSKRATEKFTDWIEQFDPDVIHLHNLHGYYINIPVLFHYLKTCGKKIIWTLHDCWAFTGHSALCDAVGCERWKIRCYDCPNIQEYPASYTDHSQSNWNKKKNIMTGVPYLTIVTPSNWLAELVKESFLGEYPVKVIHNGIDTNHFRPLPNNLKERYGIAGKRMLLGVATTWNDLKGYSDYLKLATMLDNNNQIVLVGLSNEQIKRLPHNIIGLERTNSQEELAMIYSAADVLLNLSYCETYPTNNLEARACGTPVITYGTGGCPETVGKEGIVVEKGNIDQVLLAIDKLQLKKQEEPWAHDNLVTKSMYAKQYIDVIGNQF